MRPELIAGSWSEPRAGNLAVASSGGRIASLKTHRRVRFTENPPLVTHLFWHTKSVPENVAVELLRRIGRKTVSSRVI
jgi:hypothetical protein